MHTKTPQSASWRSGVFVVVPLAPCGERVRERAVLSLWAALILAFSPIGEKGTSYTVFIDTSTPAGRFKLIRVSTVRGVDSIISISRLWTRISY